jgi:hypothetical protein
MRSYLAKNHPDLAKHLFKMALKRALAKQLVRQNKGTGFSGSFRLAPPPSSSTNKKAGSKKAATNQKPADKGAIEDVLPQVFTWVCNPKEASVAYIRFVSVHEFA